MAQVTPNVFCKQILGVINDGFYLVPSYPSLSLPLQTATRRPGRCSCGRESPSASRRGRACAGAPSVQQRTGPHPSRYAPGAPGSSTDIRRANAKQTSFVLGKSHS